MEHTNFSSTGSALREARIARGLTQEQLAALVGVTDGTVSNWEVGRTIPDGPPRKLLALVLSISLDVVDSWFTREPEAVAS